MITESQSVDYELLRKSELYTAAKTLKACLKEVANESPLIYSTLNDKITEDTDLNLGDLNSLLLSVIGIIYRGEI